ncbi:transmembrane amino acid transporter protein-domain-containing protein [Gamsiella multidivaricata]|uniref:transmembrane amino acid transporter protein-domain-containing protein n=1 Tax=Gamsiella multidivaricata TaxID=101098 RepID=UPI00221E3A8B|nr:transmembrane amino acid transporter protein-domain-containing protein [Gamsiella multidivaricata]KAI7820280.1 transmembrane amino acid transporter protein-domain-containing protein [Gamsiella multidivaricata]
MTGSRTNRSGIGNRREYGHDQALDAKLPDHGGSLFSSFLNMANSIIGAGACLPFAFQEAGLGMGIILLCALTWIVDWTVGLLVHSGKLSGRTTYQDLLEFCFGKTGLIAISIFQFIFAFGAMCAYTVIVGDTLPHVLQALIPGIEDWPVIGFMARRSFVIIFCTVMISYPLSLYRDISKLAKTSAVAMLALVVIIIAVMIEGPRAPMEIRGDPDAVWSFARPKLFQSIGVISFAFVCHHNSFLIFGSLQKPTINRVKMVTHLSMMVSLLACMILALSGYLSFSNKTQGNILNNFPSDNLIINIARFCFGVNMFTTLPLESFVCREASSTSCLLSLVIETYYFAGKPFSMKRHVIITTGLVSVALLIALMTCNLGFVLEVTGGFSATALAFILPPLCYLKLASGPILSTKKLPYLACLGFGIAVMILSTFFSLEHFLAPKDPAGASTCPM